MSSKSKKKLGAARGFATVVSTKVKTSKLSAANKTEQAKMKMNKKMGQAIDYVHTILQGCDNINLESSFVSYRDEADMTEKGAMLFRCFDSLSDGVALCQMMNQIWGFDPIRIDTSGTPAALVSNRTAFCAACGDKSKAAIAEKHVPTVEDFGANANPLVIAACVTRIQNAAHAQGTDDDNTGASNSTADDQMSETASVLSANDTLSVATTDVASENGGGSEVASSAGTEAASEVASESAYSEGGTEAASEVASEQTSVQTEDVNEVMSEGSAAPEAEAPAVQWYKEELLHPESLGSSTVLRIQSQNNLVHMVPHGDQDPATYKKERQAKWEKTLLCKLGKSVPTKAWCRDYERHNAHKSSKRCKAAAKTNGAKTGTGNDSLIQVSLHRISDHEAAKKIQGYGMKVEYTTFTSTKPELADVKGKKLAKVTDYTDRADAYEWARHGKQDQKDKQLGLSSAHKTMSAKMHGVPIGATIVRVWTESRECKFCDGDSSKTAQNLLEDFLSKSNWDEEVHFLFAKKSASP